MSFALVAHVGARLRPGAPMLVLGLSSSRRSGLTMAAKALAAMSRLPES
jgi:hypothetical protein